MGLRQEIIRFGWRKLHRSPSTDTSSKSILASLCNQVVDQFARLGDLVVIPVPLDLAALDTVEEPPANPSHPACADLAHTDYCRESWQLHLALLRTRPETHWHECDHARFCAHVPAVCQGHCLAAFKLVCPASSTTRESFDRSVELLDLIVESATRSNHENLRHLGPAGQSKAKRNGRSTPPVTKARVAQSNEAVASEVLEYIDAHLCDPKLTVAGIAAALQLHPDYLSNLFTRQAGLHMRRYITTRRVELAKELLRSTHWRIARIGLQAGYANPSWFSHLFRVHTGLSPSQYRRAEQERNLDL